jgi:hypothetical protein
VCLSGTGGVPACRPVGAGLRRAAGLGALAVGMQALREFCPTHGFSTAPAVFLG